MWVLGYRPQVPVPVPIQIFWVEKICTHYPPGYIFSRKKVPITYPYPYPPGYTRVLGYFLSKSNFGSSLTATKALHTFTLYESCRATEFGGGRKLDVSVS